jgi:hypothetical protein
VVGEGLHKIGFQPQRFVVVLDGAVVLFGVVESVGAGCVTGGIIRLQPDGLVQRFESGLHLAALTEAA